MDPKNWIIAGCCLGVPSLAWAELELAPRLGRELTSRETSSGPNKGRSSSAAPEEPEELVAGARASAVIAGEPSSVIDSASGEAHDEVAPHPTPVSSPSPGDSEPIAPSQTAADPLTEGQRIFLFELGSARLAKSELDNLEEAAELMTELLARDPAFKVVVTGHTDASGSRRSNQRLSAERAEAVARMLRKFGLPNDRIEVRGVGASMLAPDAPPEAQRRVEIDFVAGKER